MSSLQMPFIFWQKWADIAQQRQTVGANEDPNQQRNGQSVEIGKTSHESMTLDQFYHVSLNDTTELDIDQVLWRYYRHPNPDPTNTPTNTPPNILIVNQLWLWILDDSMCIEQPICNLELTFS